MSRLKRTAAALHPKHLTKARREKRAIMQFAENNGLVYFGRVHHEDEELKVVHGMTLSQRHRDDHYCIGSIRGYDLSIVERTDIIKKPGYAAHHHRWLIFAFDLLTPKDLPHVFVGHKHHNSEFYEIIDTKFDRIQKAAIGTFGAYDKEFTENYAIFTKAAHSLDGERLFNQDVAHTIMKHFGKLSVEVVGNTLYLYADQADITVKLLDTILENGLWLASAIDKNAENLP